MRGPSSELRERKADAVHASRAARSLAGIVQTIVAPSVIVGGFLAYVGAFGTDSMPVPVRLAFMVAVSLVATLLGYLAFMVAERWPWARRPFWRLGLVSTLLMFAPMGLVVWGGMNVALPAGEGPAVGAIPRFVAVSAGSTAFFCFTAAWFSRQQRNDKPSATPNPTKFLDRLPLKLRGADVWAVEAEDHYLRLHTSRGQDLILLRLAEAVVELEGIEGAQVHRSWWVARDAIAAARRSDGRATLTLKDGSEVPVSRTYAGRLRERGWI